MMISQETRDIYAIIIVGNSGVGKSVLGNIILGRQYFKHDFSARSVTDQTESTTCQLGDKYYRIYNIPGLIEGDEERIALNRREVSRAFEEQTGHSFVIIYVFGHQNGRIRNEDVVTFRAIHNAYRFSPDSLITVVNGLSPDRPSTYDKETQTTLIGLLGMQPGRICFINHLKLDGTQEADVRTYLIDTILNVRPEVHTKTNDINLMIDDVRGLEAELNKLQIEVESERHEHEAMIASMEREYEATQRLLTLRRLFGQAKANLRRLESFREQQEHLIYMLGQWEAEEIVYADDPSSDHFILARTNKQDAEEELAKNVTTQHQIDVALNVCRGDIEQICYELGQIYNGKLDREYYILFDNLRFDSTIANVKHSFLNDLYKFTCHHFGDID
ncbi:unnamed protein product [Adineta ricciae]|uniref:AIG1-type G domain-containing protein n=1 Tax=Adineta ricciae TaxID=249248 RepID=A0A815QZD7_ADIRI|nr:unnamed protein product [Adineta ricciae]CAF1469980.1 unnamed protein product [Adineta ricciae]